MAVRKTAADVRREVIEANVKEKHHFDLFLKKAREEKQKRDEAERRERESKERERQEREAEQEKEKLWREAAERQAREKAERERQAREAAEKQAREIAEKERQAREVQQEKEKLLREAAERQAREKMEMAEREKRAKQKKLEELQSRIEAENIVLKTPESSDEVIRREFSSYSFSIVNTINQIDDLVMKAEVAKTEDEKISAKIEALLRSEILLKNLPLDKIVDKYDETVSRGNYITEIYGDGEVRNMIELLRSERKHFDMFLANEYELLMSKGARRKFAETLISSIDKNIDTLCRSIVSKAEFKRSLELLEQNTRYLKNLILEEREELQRKRTSEKFIQTIIPGLGGLGLTTLNISTIAVMPGLWVSVSSAIGAGIIIESLKKLLIEDN